MHGRLRQLPNIISGFRILLVLPIAIALWRHQYVATIALFAVAAGSDAADGFLAKRFGWQTPLGGVLDPAADKLLLATVFVMLAVLGLVPIWLMAVALARDFIIVSGALAYRWYLGPVAARPTAVSKLNTLCQAVFVLAAIARAQFSLPPAWAIVALGAATFATLAVSGIDYVLRYGTRAHREFKDRAGARPAGSASP